MPLRLLEIYADAGHADTLSALAEQQGAADCYLGAVAEDGRQTVRILVTPGSQQAVLDALQGALSGSEGWRIVMLPVEAALPEPPKPPKQSTDARQPVLPASKLATREEIYEDVKAGTRLDRGFVVLTLLSTVVAAIGLLTNSVAVVIGAMVIAPLLGPNLAFAFAAAMGDRKLRALSLRTNFVGVALSLLTSFILGAVWQEPLDSTELLSRTVVGYEGIALALAAGAAAVLSLTTGVSSALVGVMVAVALLPPAVTIGMMLGAGEWERAAGAFLLLAVNVVCVNLAAQIVFIARGLGPRTWFEKRESRLLVWRNIVIWSVLLAAISAFIWLYNADHALIDPDHTTPPPIGAPDLP